VILIARLAQLGKAICFINLNIASIQTADGFVPRHDGVGVFLTSKNSHKFFRQFPIFN
jgi:hypothetical protein